jgi:hypothetical protein
MTNIRRFIGLSFSLCMQDILNNKVLISDISAIVTSTKFNTQEEAFNYYYQEYWSPYATEYDCRAILNMVWPLICQPRLNYDNADHRGHMLSHGFWLDTFTGEVTKHL